MQILCLNPWWYPVPNSDLGFQFTCSDRTNGMTLDFLWQVSDCHLTRRRNYGQGDQGVSSLTGFEVNSTPVQKVYIDRRIDCESYVLMCTASSLINWDLRKELWVITNQSCGDEKQFLKKTSFKSNWNSKTRSWIDKANHFIESVLLFYIHPWPVHPRIPRNNVFNDELSWMRWDDQPGSRPKSSRLILTPMWRWLWICPCVISVNWLPVIVLVPEHCVQNLSERLDGYSAELQRWLFQDFGGELCKGSIVDATLIKF